MTKPHRYKRKRSWRPRRGSFRRHKPKTFPLSMIPAIAVPIGAILGGGDGQTGMVAAFQSGNMSTVMSEAKNILPYELIGYRWDGVWDFGIIGRNLGLIVGGSLMHMAANKLGANNYMKRIPFLGKYVSI